MSNLITEDQFNREKTLDQAKEILAKRQDEHGEASETLKTVAVYWSVYLDKDINAHDVAMMMAFLKMSRMEHQGKQINPDNYHDAIGYLAIAKDLYE